MAKFDAVGRKCVHARGNNSQTICISVTPYKRGVYEWVVRFKKAAPVTAELPRADQSSLEAFVKWMRDDPNLQGEIERVPPDQDALLVTPRPRPAGTTPFTATAVGAVEAAINDIIHGFLQHSFRHRSENNVHCEVYRRLQAMPEMSGLHNLGSGQPVQSIHREWPEEYAARRFGAFRLNDIWPLGGATHSATPSVGRGKYDLAVLSPETVAACGSVKTYADGELSPLVAVEFGLNERFEHLRADVAKLNSNQIPRGYVVHLLRPDAKPDNFQATERLVDLVAANNPVRAAYARVEIRSGTAHYHYKFVGDPSVRTSTSVPTLGAAGN